MENLIFCSIFFFNRIDGEDIRVMLWDTAGMNELTISSLSLRSILENFWILCFKFTGQEEFDAITKAYYRGAQACVLAFSTTDRMSFEAVKEWKMKVKSAKIKWHPNVSGITPKYEFNLVLISESLCISRKKEKTHHCDKKQIRSLRWLTLLF